MLFHCRKEVQREMFLRKEAFKCCCTSGSFGHTCACNASPGALCVVGLWLRLCTVLVLKSAHLSLTRSTDPHRPLSHTHTPPHIHTPTYRMARLQSTGKPSATEAQLHTSIGILLYRGKSVSGHFSPSVSLSRSHVLKRNQLRPLVAHHSSKEAVF